MIKISPILIKPQKVWRINILKIYNALKYPLFVREKTIFYFVLSRGFNLYGKRSKKQKIWNYN
jgi:hypothetical protein